MIDPGRIAYETFIAQPLMPWGTWETLPRNHKDAWRAAAQAVLATIDNEDPDDLGDYK